VVFLVIIQFQSSPHVVISQRERIKTELAELRHAEEFFEYVSWSMLIWTVAGGKPTGFVEESKNRSAAKTGG
jgi:hypothetical protein